jgi:hypothetical protein
MSKRPKKRDEERKTEAESNFNVLVRAYVFAEKVLNSTFSKEILGKLIQAQTMYAWTPGPDLFCTLYSGTSAGCLGRRLMMQFVAHNAHFTEQSEWGTYLESFPRELLIDVTKAMSRLRSYISQRPWTKLGQGYLDEI